MAESLAVQLLNVTKIYDTGTRAVDAVTLDFSQGRTVALLGPSGCGKTTTLRLINRLEEATSGKVLVRGGDVRVQRAAALRRSIGYVIQDGGLFPHMTVAANVATVPRLLGWPRERIRGRVGEVLDLVGLDHREFGTRMPSELSGGQRQRVGVARALAADPEILLMDEPFGALDPGTREKIQDEFLLLQSRLHKTVVLVTHEMAEAAKLADEIVLMDRGQIVQRGSVGDLLFRPANERVRAFLGRHRQGLAMETLELGEVLDGIEVVAPSPQAIQLSGQLRLGQAIAALAPSNTTAIVTVRCANGNDRTISVAALRARILESLGNTA